ncbi:MAG TPA: AMP-binding protein [Candidatus Dormibacteraeota bacterium]|jgi:phenylacetate-CoA ligase
MTTDDVRRAWLSAIDAHVCHRHEAAGDSYWCPEYDRMPRERLRQVQEEKLRLAVRYLYECSPMYRRKLDAIGMSPADVRSLDDLPRLPITTKEEMSASVAERPPFGEYTAIDDAYWNAHGWLLFATSGTTAQPRAVRYTDFDRELWTWTDARALWSMGIRPGDRALLCFGYGPHVAMWGMLYALNRLRVPVIPSGGMDSRARAFALATYRPTVISATPSYALYLAGVLREQGHDPRASGVRTIIALGEPCPDATRARIRELWGDVEIHEFYGCTEAAPSCGGYTCGHALHFMEDTHLVETVDPGTHEPTPPGVPGLVVITNLCSEASPQVRFLVGDVTTLSTDACACGRTHVHCSGFAGRADDMLNIRGVTLFPSAVEDMLRRMPELGDEFQIVLDSPGRERERFRLVVEARPGADAAAVAVRVAEETKARFDLRPEVEVVAAGTLPKTEFKARRVRDER